MPDRWTSAWVSLAGLALCAGCNASAGVSLVDHVDVRMPDSAQEPVPAVILLSGCGGVRPLFDRYTKAAHDAGWAAVIVDSHSARGIGRFGARSQVCTGLRLRGQDRAADVFSALDLVRRDDRLDGSKLMLAGWSHGGWTILDAMAQAEAETGSDANPWRGVRGAFLVYPYCGVLTEADTAPIGDPFPVTLVLAGKDRIADPADCRQLAERREAEGSRFEIIFEPDLTHAFDDADQPWDPRMDYDAAGTQRALGHFQTTLSAKAD